MLLAFVFIISTALRMIMTFPLIPHLTPMVLFVCRLQNIAIIITELYKNEYLLEVDTNVLGTTGVLVSLFVVRFTKFFPEDVIVTAFVAIAVEAAGFFFFIFMVLLSKTLQSMEASVRFNFISVEWNYPGELPVLLLAAVLLESTF